MAEQSIIRFHNGSAFSSGRVDHQNCVIRGVSLITGGIEAQGHKLFCDNTTLTQLFELSKHKGQVPVTINHDGGVEDVNGWVDNFRMDGNQLRADWHLLETHDKTATMLERAEKQPTTFGMSYAFNGNPEGVLCNGKRCARADSVLSCDVVKRAAANPAGLFSAKETQIELRRLEDMLIRLARGEKLESVDTPNISKSTRMPDNPSQTQEPSLADVLNELKSIRGEFEQLKGVQDQLVQAHNQAQEGSQEEGPEAERNFLEALYQASDEELAAFNQEYGENITREQVNAAVDNFNASLESGSQEGQSQEGQMQGQEGQTQGGGEGQLAGAGAGAGAGASAAFSALQKEVLQLKSKIAATEFKAKQEAEEIQFSEIQDKMLTLANQRDAALALCDKVVAENETLQLAVRTGTRPVRAGVDDGVRMFAVGGNGELHPFQARVKAVETEKKLSRAQAILFAINENPALHADWLQNGAASRTIHA